MGTRSTIKFYERWGKEDLFVCAIYQQYDGYIEGVGKELKDFCNSGVLVNGFSRNHNKRQFNGIGCLAAQFIAEFKKETGGLYMTTENDEQEYNYVVIADTSKKPYTLNISCKEDKTYTSFITYNDEEK